MKLPPAYEPDQYEADIYALWEKKGAFTPTEGQAGKPFSTVLPPPNANANLHMGHALTVAIEDALVRYHRMKGQPTLYLPGADHAGLSHAQRSAATTAACGWLCRHTFAGSTWP